MSDEEPKEGEAAQGENQEEKVDTEAEAKLVMEAPVTYSLKDSGGNPISDGEGMAQLYEDNLTIMPKFGDILSFSYRSLSEYQASDYKVEILFSTKERLYLSELGLRYEDFVRDLVKFRNQLILKDLLMNEKMLQPTARGKITFMDSDGKTVLGSEGELRIYETALVVLPDAGDLLRVPYSDITSFGAQDYRLDIATEFGEKLSAEQLGQQFDPFTRSLSNANLALQQKVVSILVKLLPLSSPVEVRKVARFMKEGRAAKRSDIVSVSPSIWSDLEKRLRMVDMDAEYSFLKGISQQERICIGVKEGLVGQVNTQYLWFLIPIYSQNPSEPGNAIAMEASSTEETGRATYFFRIVGRRDYPNLKSMDDLNGACDAMIKVVNRAMIEINFRREPIYLDDDRLLEPKYQRYLFAVQRLKALRNLRELFIGRVFHQTPEQWKADVEDLLKFNISTLDDAVKWQKNQAETEDGKAAERK